jgi:hypothetical protein
VAVSPYLVAKTYKKLPVESIGVKGYSNALTGIVSLIANGGLEAFAATEPFTGEPDYESHPKRMRVINGTQTPSIVIRLVGNRNNYENLLKYVEDCKDRPDVACTKRFIRNINGVNPTAAGNITVEFPTEFHEEQLTDPDGTLSVTALDFELGLADVCNRDRYNSRDPLRHYTDPDEDLCLEVTP